MMSGCSSHTTWVHGETERSRGISGPESKTGTFFGRESPCFSEIQRESETQDRFSNQLSTGMPLSMEILQSVTTENCSLLSGSSFHC